MIEISLGVRQNYRDAVNATRHKPAGCCSDPVSSNCAHRSGNFYFYLVAFNPRAA